MRRGNLGSTGLRMRRRTTDPMHAFDQLPRDLRRWLNSAVLPWSPHSCAEIWRRAKKDGLSLEETLSRLARSEAQTPRRRDATLDPKA